MNEYLLQKFEGVKKHSIVMLGLPFISDMR